MSLLSYHELIEIVEAGYITNTPLERVNGSSIDITLGPTMLIESTQRFSNTPFDMVTVVDIANGDSLNVRSLTMQENGYHLEPNEFVLGHSEQKFHLPDNLSADFHLKSTLGRVGLEHMKAGWCDPWWHDSKLTLELKNLTRFHRLLLRPGMRIGQLTFHRHKPVPKDKGYAVRGRYNNDQSVSGAKPNLSITK